MYKANSYSLARLLKTKQQLPGNFWKCKSRPSSLAIFIFFLFNLRVHHRSYEAKFKGIPWKR